METNASTAQGSFVETPPTPDFDAAKTRSRATWSSGDYAVIGTTLQIVGESLAEAADVRSDERVLDVACGNGDASLAAARRFARVTGIDYVPALLERARERATAERLDIEFQEADAEALPFPDASFDVVLSTFGVMFTPDQAPAGLGVLFGGAVWPVTIEERSYAFRYRSPAHFVEVFRAFYGPVHRAFAALAPDAQAALTADLMAVLGRHDTGDGRGLVVPGTYLEYVVARGR